MIADEQLIDKNLLRPKHMKDTVVIRLNAAKFRIVLKCWRTTSGSIVDDEEKVVLERGAADKETINIWLLGKLQGSGALDRSTILDAECCRDFGANVLVDPFADNKVGLLRHSWCR